jgi:hypothetical protein
MVVDPYTNMDISTGEESRLDGIKKYRLYILYFMFLSFFVVLFAAIVMTWIPDELAYENPIYDGIVSVLEILFYAFLILMVLSPIAAMLLYPEYRIMFLVMGVVLWVLTASAWFLLFS